METKGLEAIGRIRVTRPKVSNIKHGPPIHPQGIQHLTGVKLAILTPATAESDAIIALILAITLTTAQNLPWEVTCKFYQSASC